MMYNRDPSKSRVPGTVMSPKNSMLTTRYCVLEEIEWWIE